MRTLYHAISTNQNYPFTSFQRPGRIIGDRKATAYDSKDFLIGFVPATNDTYVERELLVYPWTSLVAEFGGTLSLFLGLSFMSLWDGVHILERRLKSLVPEWNY